MTEAMPFLQKTILLSYDPRSNERAVFMLIGKKSFGDNMQITV